MDGIETRAGEDALPFVNESGMFVADGMGGGAGIRVFELDPACFETESLQKKLGSYFQINQYDQETAEVFNEYVKENFASLTNKTMADLYRNPEKYSSRLKKSGYIGSHALGTAFAGELILLDQKRRRKGQLSENDWDDEVRRIRDGLVKKYREIIRELGAKCPKVSMTKIDYYGTTFSAAFFRENETSVDVWFLNCGDSRCYVWDKQGFRQAVDDQGRNGGMTSKFSLTEDLRERNIEILLERKTYPTPCVLYCMTDGIFSSFSGTEGFHSSPLYMEGMFLQRLANSDSMEEAQQKITAMFDKGGQIDDSNSMIMAAFGFSQYAGLREFAKFRLESLYHKYELNKYPNDFLTTDYSKKFAPPPVSVDELLERAYDSVPGLQKYCAERIQAPEFQNAYLGGVASLNERLKSQEANRAKIFNTLRNIVEENFLAFFPHVSAAAIANTIQAANKAAEDYAAALKNRRNAAENLVAKTGDLTTTAANFRSHSQLVVDIQNWNEENRISAGKSCQSLREAARKSLSDIQTLFDFSEAADVALAQNLETWKAQNREITKQLGNIDSYIERWIALEDCSYQKFPQIALSKIKAFDGLRRAIRNTEREMQTVRAEISRESEAQARKYWRDHKNTDIRALLNSGTVFSENPAIKREIEELYRRNEEAEKNRGLVEKQKQVFDDYLTAYLKDVGEEQRLDVERNGWM